MQTRRGQCSRSGDAPLLQSHTYRASSHARQRATRHDGRRAPASAEQQMPDGLHGSWHARLELDVRLWSYQAATPITRSRSRVTQRGQRQEKKRQSVSSCGEARASLSESSVRVPRQRTYMCTVPSAQCPVVSTGPLVKDAGLLKQPRPARCRVWPQSGLSTSWSLHCISAFYQILSSTTLLEAFPNECFVATSRLPKGGTCYPPFELVVGRR